MKRFIFWSINLMVAAGLGWMAASQDLLAASASALPDRLAASSLAAAPTPSDDQVNAVAKQLFCPVCENIPLDVCPTQACAQWRDLIRQKLAAGWSGDQIKQYFAAQYGDRVLAEPPLQGPNRLVNSMFYVLIGVSILAGAFVLVRVLMGMVGRSRAAAQSAAPVQPDGTAVSEPYVSRIEEDLRRRK